MSKRNQYKRIQPEFIYSDDEYDDVTRPPTRMKIYTKRTSKKKLVNVETMRINVCKTSVVDIRSLQSRSIITPGTNEWNVYISALDKDDAIYKLLSTYKYSTITDEVVDRIIPLDSNYPSYVVMNKQVSTGGVLTFMSTSSIETYTSVIDYLLSTYSFVNTLFDYTKKGLITGQYYLAESLYLYYQAIKYGRSTHVPLSDIVIKVCTSLSLTSFDTVFDYVQLLEHIIGILVKEFGTMYSSIREKYGIWEQVIKKYNKVGKYHIARLIRAKYEELVEKKLYSPIIDIFYTIKYYECWCINTDCALYFLKNLSINMFLIDVHEIPRSQDINVQMQSDEIRIQVDKIASNTVETSCCNKCSNALLQSYEIVYLACRYNIVVKTNNYEYLGNVTIPVNVYSTDIKGMTKSRKCVYVHSSIMNAISNKNLQIPNAYTLVFNTSNTNPFVDGELCYKSTQLLEIREDNYLDTTSILNGNLIFFSYEHE